MLGPMPAAAVPPLPSSARSRRVVVLLVGIIVLSVIDLLLTLDHLQTSGLLEANPLVVMLVESTRSAWVLSAYKAATVGICVALLYRLRRHRASEIGAWCGLTILVALAVLWQCYEEEVTALEGSAVVFVDSTEAWIHLRP